PAFQQAADVALGIGIVARPLFRPNGIVNGLLHVDNEQSGVGAYPHESLPLNRIGAPAMSPGYGGGQESPRSGGHPAGGPYIHPTPCKHSHPAGLLLRAENAGRRFLPPLLPPPDRPNGRPAPPQPAKQNPTG